MGGVETTVLHLFFFYASPQYPFTPLFISSEMEERRTNHKVQSFKFQVPSFKFKVKSSK